MTDKSQHKHKKHSKEQELESMLNDLQKEKDQIFEKLQRVSADYANYQKRIPKQIADAITYEKESIIKSMLPAMDNFDHTLQNAQTADDITLLVKAINIIYGQMLDILKSHNVEQIKTEGQKFDPALHQAVMQKSDPEKDENIILEEFQKGYKLNDRVIRPSKVIVNKIQNNQPSQDNPDEKKENRTE